jgi:SAM-dependent methyltransferase
MNAGLGQTTTPGERMAIRLHVGCGTVYLDGYVNIDVEVQGYSFLAGQRSDLMERNRTTVDRYYKQEESQATLERGPREPQACVVDRYAAIGALPYPPDSVDEIRSVQVLEHVGMKEAPVVLRHWHSLLKPGGFVHVDVPDFEETARQLLAQRDEAAKDWYYRLVYGSQKNAYAFHKNGFSPARLEWLLREAGFRDVRHLPNTIHFYPVVIAEGIK